MGITSLHDASDSHRAPGADKYDMTVERLKVEFQDFASDALDGLIKGGRTGDSAADETIDNIRRCCHNLKGMGGSFGYLLITLLAHRMEDYLAGSQELDGPTLQDAQVFVDRMRDVMDGRFDDIAKAEVVRTLPAKNNFNVGDVVKQDVEVLLVMPRNTSTQIVEHELLACGYRVVTETEPFKAVETVVRTSPDFIIAAAVMEDLSGIDLACALHAMPISRDRPLIILTSLVLDHPSFEALPDTVPVVRKGDHFADDIAVALAILGIT